MYIFVCWLSSCILLYNMYIQERLCKYLMLLNLGGIQSMDKRMDRQTLTLGAYRPFPHPPIHAWWVSKCRTDWMTSETQSTRRKMTPKVTAVEKKRNGGAIYIWKQTPHQLITRSWILLNLIDKINYKQNTADMFHGQ